MKKVIDVYKRQGFINPRLWRRAVQEVTYGGEYLRAVSYTHLDVYKRQAFTAVAGME